MLVFAHVSDIHIDSDPRSLDRTRAVMDYLNDLPYELDAIIVSGDIADHGLDAEYERARKALSSRHPVLICPGNHDDRTAFRRVLLGTTDSTAPVNQVRRTSEYVIALCDSSIPGRHDGLLDDATLAWLADELTQTPETTPVLIGFHHPPTPLHIPVIDAIRQFGEQRLADLATRHPNIVAFLAGHAHTAAATTFAGRPRSPSTSSTTSAGSPRTTGPSSRPAVRTRRDDRRGFRSRPLPDPQLPLALVGQIRVRIPYGGVDAPAQRPFRFGAACFAEEVVQEGVVGGELVAQVVDLPAVEGAAVDFGGVGDLAFAFVPVADGAGGQDGGVEPGDGDLLGGHQAEDQFAAALGSGSGGRRAAGGQGGGASEGGLALGLLDASQVVEADSGRAGESPIPSEPVGLPQQVADHRRSPATIVQAGHVQVSVSGFRCHRGPLPWIEIPG
jgi:Icc-related predicted phosphoesterase